MSSVLGRAYGLHILDAISNTEESAFSQILEELGISPTTLSRTLKELVQEGLAEKRVYGRRSYYSITQKGTQILEKYREGRGGGQFDIDRIAQLVARRLKENGAPDRFQISNEEFISAVRRRVKRFVKEVGQELEKDLGTPSTTRQSSPDGCILTELGAATSRVIE